MTEHELKTVAPYFEAVKSGAKTFEVRKDDRNFQVGDTLVLREWLNDYGASGGGYFTCRVCRHTITYKLAGGQFGIADGYCVLGLGPWEAPRD